MPAPTTLPIILAHGICPFDRALHPLSVKDNAPDDRFHYFRKIRNSLIARGFSAYHTRVSWASDLERRASDLHRQILRLTENFSIRPAVHIIAHSMGGLDARMMIYKYRMAGRVRSLTTIGTPHLGTSYADWGMERLGFLIGSAGVFGINIRGFRDLTRESCRRFNETLRPFEKDCGVRFRTVAGAQTPEKIFLPLRRSYRIILEQEGENDGLVSVASAMWKEEFFLEKIDADHFNQIGRWDRGEAAGGMDRE
ncbi:MAG: hypothetical protein ABII06_07080, partial [Pseudomonadota bacterium]